VRRFYSVRSLLATRVGAIRRRSQGMLREHFYQDEDRTRPFDVDWGCGGAMFCPMSLYPDPLHFDERFFLYFEDVDLCSRLWQRGYAVQHYPAIAMMHHESKKSHASMFYLARHVSSLLKYMLKFWGLPDRERLTARSRKK
jgi:GT2 family glycosyltransferase